MDSALQQQLHTWYQQWQQEDAAHSDRLQRWRNIEPESAALLALWVRSKQAQQVLEIGTSNGYSTVWLADAVRATGGHVDSLDIEASRSALALQHLQQVGLDTQVTLHTADAADFLAHAQATYEVILLDAERGFYVNYWPDLRRLLLGKRGALLVVDNVLSHAEQVADFITLIQADTQMCSHTVNSGAGLLCVTVN
ncbi:class I SAM-dependent methyltransferase [Vitreoscilla massiliensis]|uniref:Class I SAM-dependent methyltransferase n=1 Tax=Vitreoscilla massiliensis TaxID=1689272 RepID=A0ABY4E556_9NEIS|nr:class I SAM-dependent methyltransferase [Vitreoscilla massiliensis]UOO90000.1 class I SAM-dependent methyltransferase [Vitreoscilla massiliensis]